MSHRVGLALVLASLTHAAPARAEDPPAAPASWVEAVGGGGVTVGGPTDRAGLLWRVGLRGGHRLTLGDLEATFDVARFAHMTPDGYDTVNWSGLSDTRVRTGAALRTGAVRLGAAVEWLRLEVTEHGDGYATRYDERSFGLSIEIAYTWADRRRGTNAGPELAASLSAHGSDADVGVLDLSFAAFVLEARFVLGGAW